MKIWLFQIVVRKARIKLEWLRKLDVEKTGRGNEPRQKIRQGRVGYEIKKVCFWVDGWMCGCKSQYKDCLHNQKACSWVGGWVGG